MAAVIVYKAKVRFNNGVSNFNIAGFNFNIADFNFNNGVSNFNISDFNFNNGNVGDTNTGVSSAKVVSNT